MIKYIVGALVGGALGFFILYRLIGCGSGTCSITANPYISTIYGVMIGLLVAGMIGSGASAKEKERSGKQNTEPSNITGAGEGFDKSSDKAPGEIIYKKLSAKEAKARIDSGDEVIILDVRTEAEYTAEHIKGAILIPNETISNQRPELLPNPDAEILIYCRSGNRSAQAAKKLIALGYTNVYDFGGIIDWPYETVVGSG